MLYIEKQVPLLVNKELRHSSLGEYLDCFIWKMSTSSLLYVIIKERIELCPRYFEKRGAEHDSDKKICGSVCSLFDTCGLRFGGRYG